MLGELRRRVSGFCQCWREGHGRELVGEAQQSWGLGIRSLLDPPRVHRLGEAGCGLLRMLGNVGAELDLESRVSSVGAGRALASGLTFLCFRLPPLRNRPNDAAAQPRRPCVKLRSA